MEFGIGFVLGGVSTGVTVANWDSVHKVVRQWALKTQSAVRQKVAARLAALKSKL